MLKKNIIITFMYTRYKYKLTLWIKSYYFVILDRCILRTRRKSAKSIVRAKVVLMHYFLITLQCIDQEFYSNFL